MTWLNWPNRITIARIMLVVPLVICLLNLNSDWPHWRHAAFALFFAMAVSDGLDGFLARRLGEETPLGEFLDPLADKLLITCAVILLAVEPTAVPDFRLAHWVPVITIGKDVLTVIGFLLVYAVTGLFFIQPRTWGKACTLVQLAMVGYVLIAPDLPRSLRWFLPHLSWAACGMAIIALADYVRIGNRFAAEHYRSQSRSKPDE